MTKIRIYFPTVNLSLVKVLGKIEYFQKKKNSTYTKIYNMKINPSLGGLFRGLF